MKQINTYIKVELTRLDLASSKMRARLGSSHVVEISNVPTDIDSVCIRICINNGAFRNIPATQNESDVRLWYCRIPSICFDVIGGGWYEVRAIDSHGDSTALARGDVSVMPFSEERMTHGKVYCMDIMDVSGGLHGVYFVKNELNEWTLQVDEGASKDNKSACMDIVESKVLRVVDDGVGGLVLSVDGGKIEPGTTRRLFESLLAEDGSRVVINAIADDSGQWTYQLIKE